MRLAVLLLVAFIAGCAAGPAVTFDSGTGDVAEGGCPVGDFCMPLDSGVDAPDASLHP